MTTNTIIRSALKQSFLRPFLQQLQLVDWKRRGRPVPPPNALKQQTVRKYAKRFETKILVETGTYLGDMIYTTQASFDKVFSIELNEELHQRAQERFAQNKHIVLYQGDSATVLPLILNEIKEPALFWLDAHYSGAITARAAIDTPIIQELIGIFAHPLAEKHVILIDDARHFTGENDYPKLEELRLFILERFPMWKFEVKDDVIRAHKG